MVNEMVKKKLIDELKEDYERIKPYLRRLDHDITQIPIVDLPKGKSITAAAGADRHTIYCKNIESMPEYFNRFILLHELGHIYHHRIDSSKEGMFRFIFRSEDNHYKFDIVNKALTIKDKYKFGEEITEGFANYFACDMFRDLFPRQRISCFGFAGYELYNFFTELKKRLGHESVIAIVRNPGLIDYNKIDDFMENYRCKNQF